jgi:uncharacterized protein (TIGR02453 family)
MGIHRIGVQIETKITKNKYQKKQKIRKNKSQITNDRRSSKLYFFGNSFIKYFWQVAMETKSHFDQALFDFLKDLKKNNNRPWFKSNKARYESDVRGALLHFIEAFRVPLKRISAHFVVDPRPVGGSLFRIYRDVRFSPDKSPYKTNVGVQFRHESAKDVHAPGFYLHLEPGRVFVASGSWHPDSKALAKIRDAIVDDAQGWKKVKGNRKFKNTCVFAGESLKRVPRGYDPEHPFLEDLKRKDFIVTTEFTEEDARDSDFMIRVGKTYEAAKPFMKFLTKALGIPF